MNTTANALAELRKQIEANKKLLAEQENALAVLERMMGQASSFSAPASPTLPAKKVESGTLDLGELDIAVNGDKPTLRDQIVGVISRIGDQEFTGSHIDAALKKDGITVNGKYPRSRIAMVLAKLEAEGALTRTFTGGGNVPHKYKNAFESKGSA